MYLRKISSKAVKVPARTMATVPQASTLIQQVTQAQKERADRVVPWFLNNMPASYFKFIPDQIQSQHVQAIATVKELSNSDMSLKLSTVDSKSDVQHITYINSGAQTGLLHSQIKALENPAGRELTHVHVFSSLDNSLALNVFSFDHKSKVGASEHATKADAKHIYDYIAEVKAGKYVTDASVPKYSELFNEANMEAYLKNITPSYASKSIPRRFLIQREMYEKVKGSEGVLVHIEPFEANSSWVSVAAANVLPEVLLRLCSAMTSARGLNVSNAHLDSVLDPTNNLPDHIGNVTMLRLLVSSNDPQLNLNTNAEFSQTFSSDLKRAKWLDNETTDLGLNRHPELGLDKAEVITAFCSMLHGPLHKADAQKFTSIKSIIQLIDSNKNYVGIADSIAQLFLERFNPKLTPALSDKAYQDRCAAIQAKISMLQKDEAVLVLSKILKAVQSTLRTNFFNEDRYALSLRVDPNIMATGTIGTTAKTPLPFGLFFVHGRHFNGFHNRFRDIARGGLRIVTPGNSDQYAQESSRQFDEVYGLSLAQQLKNKDIPEGGAKGVILVNAPAIEKSARPFAMRKAIKAFTDSMLDLIVKDSVSKLVDFYKKEELIYFGPDEQVIPYDIDWIIKRAAVRGYPIPDALMSSKQDNGINHKVYGVTSEGVVVYLDVALRRSLGINPNKDSFTVKVTGGPDGDVAGNLIRILFRDYGSNCKVVGVADGFGVAEDPEGLNQEELLRLVKESLPITHFNSTKLSKKGLVMVADNEEGINRRNTMHNRVQSDAFVPAGGRPNTINADNWRAFLNEKGEPSSKLIVEGANIFITPEARTGLFETGKVAIVKDSSANKCGVITSSCEVAGSMLLSKKEFMDHKPEIVEDVLVQLRKLARLEGELLFREYNNYPGALPHFSEQISVAIAKVTDAVTDALADVQPEDALFKELFPLIREGLPKKMLDIGGDRIAKNFPVQYQRNAIASALASKLVYKEGIQLVLIQPDDMIAKRAFEYYRQDQRIQKLAKEVETSTAPLSAENKAVIVDILNRGGARAVLNIF